MMIHGRSVFASAGDRLPAARSQDPAFECVSPPRTPPARNDRPGVPGTTRRTRWIAHLVCALSTAILVFAGPAAAAVTTNQIAVPRPPMGWASWNTFASAIDATTIRAQVDA